MPKKATARFELILARPNKKKRYFRLHCFKQEKTKQVYKKQTNPVAEQIKKQVTVEQVLSHYGIDITKKPTNCPMHSSKKGQCLSFKDDVWKCFH